MAITLLAYAYWPLMYFGVYLPLIVPNLDRWKHIPYWIPILAFLGFVFVLMKLGSISTQRAIILHSVGLSILGQFLLISMAYLSAPGFRNTPGPFEEPLIRYLLSVVVTAICLLAPAEVGHFLFRGKATRQ